MTDHVADRLQRAIDATGSIACVGLDPRPNLIPQSLIAEAAVRHGRTRLAAAWAFARCNERILRAIAGACACVKPQVACYEAYGAPGIQALEDTIAEARRLGIQVIVDAKRGDIGSTAEHYAQAWIGAAPDLHGDPLPAAQGDWLTVNGYLGGDSVTPFLGDRSHGVFVLVKTSNKGGADVQDQPSGAATVADRMAELVRGWGAGRLGASGLSDVGAVVGATWPDQARALRRAMPDTLFLVPGYGAQGGSAADALAGLRSDGRGVIVNSSRGIIGAWQQGKTEDVGAAARAALEAMNRDLAGARPH